MFNRILLPLDGSALAERALAHAEQFARIFGGSIFLLYVLEPPDYQEQPRVIDPITWQIRKAEAESYLCGIAAQIRTNLGENPSSGRKNQNTRVHYSILEGKTAENIIEYARVEGIDLLVISTHGSGGLSHWNLGSVIQKVIDLIYLPVLIVRANLDPAIAGNRIGYKRILLPLDCSRRAELAIPAGIVLATSGNLEQVGRSEEAKLIMAKIIQSPQVSIPKPFPDEIAPLFERYSQLNREAVRYYLNGLKRRIPAGCEIRIIENDNIFAAIHEIADKDDIDLVILSAHGSNGQFFGPYGMVTRNYIEYGVKPLLILQDVPRSLVRLTAAQMTVAHPAGMRSGD